MFEQQLGKVVVLFNTDRTKPCTTGKYIRTVQKTLLCLMRPVMSFLMGSYLGSTTSPQGFFLMVELGDTLSVKFPDTTQVSHKVAPPKKTYSTKSKRVIEDKTAFIHFPRSLQVRCNFSNRWNQTYDRRPFPFLSNHQKKHTHNHAHRKLS
jgi:hypothetical protein